MGIHNCKKNSVRRILLGISQVPVWIPKQVSVYQPRRHWRSTLYVLTYVFSSVTSNSVIFLCIEGKKSAPVWNYGTQLLLPLHTQCMCNVHKAAFWQDDLLLHFNFIFCHHDVTSKPWEMLKQSKWLDKKNWIQICPSNFSK